MEPSPSNETRQQTRGRYQRLSVACTHCRRRKLRCILATDDTQGRCSNCIRRRRECNLETEARRDRKERVALREELVKQAREIAIESVVNNESHFRIGEDRGRTPVRDRATSPNHYSENERTRSQSPAGSFYHGDSPARGVSPIGSDSHASYNGVLPSHRMYNQPAVFRAEPLRDPEHTTGNLAYEYTSLRDDEIRLLRITPGAIGSPLRCSLKIVSMEKIKAVVHEFQALSYAWGDDTPSYNILLNDLTKVSDGSPTAPTEPRIYLIRENLYQALQHIRLTDEYLWLWVDYLCIEQTNQEEKSQQIPKMPFIYSSAWNVIAWLGVDGTSVDDESAVRLIADILNLKKLDIDLRREPQSDDFFHFQYWMAFGRILQRPWFRRRWVIQEVACARRLSVRIANKILSWLDFADAVDLYSDHFEQVRARIRSSEWYNGDCEGVINQLDAIHTSEAVELMRFSRNVFQRSPDSTIVSRLMSLESLVLTASSFAVSEVRDTIYALLYLANDMHDVVGTSTESQMHHAFTSDYSKHPVDIFKNFVRYSIAKSSSLDVLYRRWASWPRLNAHFSYHRRHLPSWIGVATYGAGYDLKTHTPSDSFLGPVGSQIYHASHGVTFQGQSIPPSIDDTIQLEGMLLGTAEIASVSAVSKGLIRDDWLKTLGWRGSLDGGIDDQLWRTLVADRDPESKVAPTWYRRACALALTQLNHLGDLNSAAIIADTSQPSTLIEYLKRVQNATEGRKIFRCASVDSDISPTGYQTKAANAVVGLGPEHMSGQDESLVCILYGSSVPVILSRIDDKGLQGDNICHVRLVGACYAYGYMEGEVFASMSKKEIDSKTMKFRIH